MEERYSMQKLRDKIRGIAFDISTIKWMSHAPKDSDYERGWNDALNSVRRELLLSLEDIELCKTCEHYEIRPSVPDWNICNEHADYRSSDDYCSDYKKKENKK